MAISFPTSLDSLTNPTGANNLNNPDHATQHSNVNDAVEALEAKVGVDSSAVATSLDYLVKNTASSDPGHKHTYSSISATGTPSATTFLRGDGTWSVPAAASFIGCRVYKSASQNGTGTGEVTVTFDSENFDTDTMHDNVTNNSRITFTTAGKYCVIGNVNHSANAAQILKIKLNGTTVISRNAQGNSAVTEGISTQCIYNFSATDYVELINQSGSNGNINTDSHFEAWKIG